MAENIAGDVARQMAAGPIVPQEPRPENKAPKGGKQNPFSAVLGAPSFVAGDGREYDAQTGFGNNRKPHPLGGKTSTIAWIAFKPFKGLDTPVEGRIYRHRYNDANGKEQRDYTVTLSFLKIGRGDAKGREALDSLKDELMSAYVEWRKTSDIKPTVATSKRTAGSWHEEGDSLD